MSRFVACVLSSLGVSCALALGLGLGCSSSDLVEPDGTDAGGRRDSAPVAPAEAGPALDSGPTVAPSCDQYCSLVTANCTGANAQYATADDCVAFCRHLPLESDAIPAPSTLDKASPSVACRQYWADSPSATDPKTYCPAAGPFGGDACGDLCTAFCDVLLDACPANAAGAPYPSRPECASACANFAYTDAGVDGGGVGPLGPDGGDTLNCRLYHLRAATKDPSACAALRPDSGACAK